MLEIVPHLKSCESAKVWVKEDHGEGGQLSSSIPAITAVNQHRCLTILNLKTLSINILNSLTVNSNINDYLISNLDRPSQNHLDVFEPTGGLKATQPVVVVVDIRKTYLPQLQR